MGIVINKIYKYILLIILIFPSISFSQNLVVDITEGNVDPLPIALQSFISKGDSDDLSENILRVINNDLISTGLFNVIDKQAYIEKPISPSVRPVFNNWDPLGAKALVTGSVNLDGSGVVEVEFRLWDVVTEQDLTGLKLSVDSKYWRRLSHCS